MIGAIIGDIVGSRFEFNNTDKKNFQLFHPDCSYTDDTICTVAIADAILRNVDYKTVLLEWCRCYPHPKGAYGGSFARWIFSADPQPYYSYGNGAAMRVSPVAWAFNSEAKVLREAIKATEVTHNHPEGLIGASVVARAIYLLRTMNRPTFLNGAVYNLVEAAYGENWDKQHPARGVFDETCQGCVPLAFHICAQSSSFERAIRQAVAWGGDSDTLAAIVGSLAEARFGVPDELVSQALSYLPDEMREIVIKFRTKYAKE